MAGEVSPGWPTLRSAMKVWAALSKPTAPPGPRRADWPCRTHNPHPASSPARRILRRATPQSRPSVARAAENRIFPTRIGRPRQHRSVAFLRQGCEHLVGVAVEPHAQHLRGLGAARAFSRASSVSQAARASSFQSAVSEAASCAWLFRITPSSRIFRPLARKVAPVVVMSTITSAVPAAGAPSVAPALGTMR